MTLVVGMLWAGSVSAQACPQHFYAGKAPIVTQVSFAKNTQALCNEGYAVLYSGQTKTPLWSAEYLNPARITRARRQKRDSEFKEDGRVPAAWRARLDDYVHSGFDRGHVAPSGDMPTKAAQEQSFLLSNIIPQNAHLNRGAWASLEDQVRNYAYYRSVYVITGPLFVGQKIGFLKGRVAVPTHVYKIVYDPQLKAGVAYVALNQPQAQIKRVPIAEISKYSYINYGFGNVPMLDMTVRKAPRKRKMFDGGKPPFPGWGG